MSLRLSVCARRALRASPSRSLSPYASSLQLAGIRGLASTSRLRHTPPSAPASSAQSHSTSSSSASSSSTASSTTSKDSGPHTHSAAEHTHSHDGAATHSHDHGHGGTATKSHSHDGHDHSHSLFHSHDHAHSEGAEQIINALKTGKLDRGTKITLLGESSGEGRRIGGRGMEAEESGR